MMQDFLALKERQFQKLKFLFVDESFQVPLQLYPIFN